jgi:hypothetical protein
MQMNSPLLLAGLLLSRPIAYVTKLHLTHCTVPANILATVPEMYELELEDCKMPEQWGLDALPGLCELNMLACSGLTSLDASSATSLSSLKLAEIESLKGLALPPGLQELTCEGLPELTDLDLRAVSPHAEVVVKRCPALRLRTAHMTIEP